MSDKLKGQVLLGAVLVLFGALLFAMIAEPIAQGAHVGMLAVSPSYRAAWETEQAALSPLRAFQAGAGAVLAIAFQVTLLALTGAFGYAGLRYVYIRSLIVSPTANGYPMTHNSLGAFVIPTATGGAAITAAQVLPVATGGAFDLVATMARGDLAALAIGRADDGRVLTAPIERMMHTLAVGASGWGKSTWLRALLWQVATAATPVDVALVDVNGSEFNYLHDWARLLFPIARCESDALAVLSAVAGEVDRRRDLWQARPMAFDLPSYNLLATEPLSPLLLVVDEGTLLLDDNDAARVLRRCVLGSRQYGVNVVLTGQTAKANSIDTSMRDSFSTRLGLRTSQRSLRVVFDATLTPPTARGRAWYSEGGAPPVLVQAPYVSREALAGAIQRGGVDLVLPDLVTVDTGDDAGARIIALAAQGLSKRKIAQAVYGYTGGAAYGKVDAVLGGTTTTF